LTILFVDDYCTVDRIDGQLLLWLQLIVDCDHITAVIVGGVDVPLLNVDC